MKLLAVLLVTLVVLASGCSLAADVTPPPRTLTPKARATEAGQISSYLVSSTPREFSQLIKCGPSEPPYVSVLQTELQQVLGTEFSGFLEHLGRSTCHPVQRRGEYLLLEHWTPHVGGYQSLILIRESDGALFLLWLKGALADVRELRVRSRVPVEDSALREFSREMNTSWGHRACFVPEPESSSLRIDKARRC